PGDAAPHRAEPDDTDNRFVHALSSHGGCHTDHAGCDGIHRAVDRPACPPPVARRPECRVTRPRPEPCRRTAHACQARFDKLSAGAVTIGRTHALVLSLSKDAAEHAKPCFDRLSTGLERMT